MSRRAPESEGGGVEAAGGSEPPASAARRLGLLGGTFDPPHFGHLVAAQEAFVALGLERVLFLPAGRPPHKQGVSVSAVEHRVEMTRLAIAGDPRFALSLADVERPGTSYTVELLAALRRQLGPAPELYFVVGMDSLLELPTWRDPAGVLRLARLVAVHRPGYRPPDLSTLEAQVPGARERVTLLAAPGIDVSSTELRARAAAGRPIRYLVPDAVAAYVAEHRLYR